MKKQFSVLIVDDERLARKDLCSLLSEYDNITILGEADDVPSAMQAITELNPDVIFLDIQMPGESGFDLLAKITVEAKIIFVTAFDEYAIRAFEVNALDYLLKPVNPDRLRNTLERLETGEKVDFVKNRELHYDDRLFIMVDDQFKFLKINNIKCVCSAGDYSEVITTDGNKGLTLKSMKEWESRLPGQYFCRIHRSTIINMDYIERFEKWFNYSFRVYLEGIESPFTVSRRFAVQIKERFG